MWTSGASWVDQQWLAQLLFYGLYALGGIKLVLLSHAALLTAAFATALAFARLRGASEKSVCLLALLGMFAAPWELQFRAQTLGTLLFVWVAVLLLSDSRAPSRRVLLVLPLLALWANVHGTVVLGGLLAVARGATIALGPREPHRRLRAGLLLLAPLCVLASPYGTGVGGYYHRLLANPRMSRFVDEWRASAPSASTALFYLLAFLAVWLVARLGHRLTRFEQLALGLTLVAGLWAIRSIAWFALVAMMVLPVTLDAALASRPRRAALRHLRGRAGAAAAVVALSATGVAAAQPASWYVHRWPNNSIPALRELSRSPATRVFANDRYADWILWQVPELRGRIAYDIRFELLGTRRFRVLYDYRSEIGDNWRRGAAGYGVLVFEPRAERKAWAAVRREPGARVLYADRDIGLVARRPRP